ncbi:MAG: CHAD domain-containing protein [Pseudomonadota bacterium]
MATLMAHFASKIRIALTGPGVTREAFETLCLGRGPVLGRQLIKREGYARRSRSFDRLDGGLSKAGLSLSVEERADGTPASTRRVIERRVIERHDASRGPAWVGAYRDTRTGLKDIADPIGFAAFDDLVRANGGKNVETVNVATLTSECELALIEEGGALLEIVLEKGSVVTASSQERVPFAQLQMSLIDGPVDVLFDFGRAAVSGGGLRPTLDGPASGALATIGATSRGSLGKTPKINLGADDAADGGLTLGLSVFARRLCALAPVLIETDISERTGLEAAWQTRVALRRFRALERVYRRALPLNSVRDLNVRARGFARLIGVARDWDVFLSETLPQYTDGIEEDISSEVGFSLLQTQAEAEKHEAWRAARTALSGPGYAHFLLDLIETATLKPWHSSAAARQSEMAESQKQFSQKVDNQKPDRHLRALAPAFAAAALNRRLKAASQTAKQISLANLQTLHDLRLDLKKLRYTAQAFRMIYPKEKRKPYFLALSTLQEKLGKLNDAVVAQSLASDASAGQGALALRAANQIIAEKSQLALSAAEDVVEDWEAIEAMQPYWQAVDLSPFDVHQDPSPVSWGHAQLLPIPDEDDLSEAKPKAEACPTEAQGNLDPDLTSGHNEEAENPLMTPVKIGKVDPSQC